MSAPSRRGRLSALIFVVALIGACGKSPEKAPVAASQTVTAASLEQLDLNRVIDSSGAIAAREEMSLGVELSGIRVAEVLVEVGDNVHKGEVLLQLDRRTLEAELRQVRATLAQARANQGLAHANADRARALRERKLMAAGDIEQLIANESVADAGVLNAQAALASAQLRLDFASLRAPDDGQISARSVQPGQVIASGAELMRMIRNGTLEWRAQLPEAEFLQVLVGAQVRIVAPGGVVTGKVRARSPGLDAVSRTGMVYADIDTPDKVIAGMFAHGQIVLGGAEASMLPSAAIVERDGYRYAFVLGANEVVSQRRIEVGQSSGDRTEIISGIQPDERVVIQGAAFLSDGDRVRVVAGDAVATPEG